MGLRPFRQTFDHRLEMTVEGRQDSRVSGQCFDIGPAKRQTGVRQSHVPGNGSRIEDTQRECGESGSRVGFDRDPQRSPIGTRLDLDELLAEVQEDATDGVTIRDPVAYLLRVGKGDRGMGEALLEESDGRLLADELGDGFVEVGLVRKKGGRVDEFVKEGFDEARWTAFEHGCGDRIGKPTQGRVGRDGAHTDVESFFVAESGRFGFGPVAIEIALVGKFADEREPMRDDFEGSWPRSHERRHDPVAGPIDESGVLVVDVQSEIPGQFADRFDELEESSHALGMRRVEFGLGERLSSPKEFHLAGGEMAVVATAEIQNEEERGQGKESGHGR